MILLFLNNNQFLLQYIQKMQPNQKIQTTVDLFNTIADQIKQENGNQQEVTVLTLKNRKFMYIDSLELKKLPFLQIIDLRNNRIVEMVGFQLCHNLEQLHLCENLITRVKRIKHLKKLKMIDLRDNHITDLDRDLHNLPESVVELRARINKICFLYNIFKLDNKFDAIWLDENRFIKGTRNYFKRIFQLRNTHVPDLWM